MYYVKMNDDFQLVRAYAEHGSEPAFETLVNRHIDFVHSAALRQVRDPHLAEEITQAVFILFARKAGSLDKNTVLPSWLFRATQFAVIDTLRSQQRRRQREQEFYMQNTLIDNAGNDENHWCLLCESKIR